MKDEFGLHNVVLSARAGLVEQTYTKEKSGSPLPIILLAL